MPLLKFISRKRAFVVAFFATIFAFALLSTPAYAQLIQGATLKEAPLKSGPSESATTLMNIPEGTTLQFKENNSNSEWFWGLATIDGKKQTVYLNKEFFIPYEADNTDLVKGAAIFGDINIYQSPNKNGKVLEKFPEGSTLQFIEFNKDFYFGKLPNEKIVYVPRDQIARYRPSTNGVIEAYPKSGSVKAYVAPYPESPVHLTLTGNRKLYFADFSNQWYMAKIKVDGATKTAFFKKSDLSTTQQAVNPPAGQDAGNTIVTQYSITLNQAASYIASGAPVKWNGSRWARANVSEVKAAMNPANAPKGTDAHLQFLRLDHRANVPVDEINSYLSGKGILANQGQAFIDGANTHKINELYLIAHAQLETGNGKSLLSKGLWYNPDYSDPRDPKKHWVAEQPEDTTGWVRVYNMYGVGAVDGNAINGGTDYAYRKGWTSPYKAIVGGAEFIGARYISKGQNTLYKMRWNPDYMNKYRRHPIRMYATDIYWARKQTTMIANMYKGFKTYTQTFEVPRYAS